MTGRSILIINQAWSNHGDEAAHKAMLRMLRRRFPDSPISVLAYSDMVTDEEVAVFGPDEVAGLEYVRQPRKPPRKRLIWASRFSIPTARRILLGSRRYRKAMRLMQDADIVISAPGGVDLGPYRNWLHLALLLLAVESGTPTAVYSCSLGPLPHEDADDERFSALTIHVLQRLAFLSLRETTSQHFARELGVPYVAATDTAFLDTTQREIQDDLRERLSSAYMVVVPNELHRWYGRFRNHARALEEVCRHLIVASVETGCPVALMPHLFGGQNDSDYCESLRRSCPPEYRQAITTLPKSLPIEVIRAIVAEAEMVVSARCHPIILALQTATPILALSYEHKMQGLLDQAGLSQYMVSIEDPAKVDPTAVALLLQDIYDDRRQASQLVGRSVPRLRGAAEAAADEFARQFGGRL